MLFYYIFSKNDGSWVKIEGEGNNPARVKKIKWSSNKNNTDINFAKNAISDLHPGYGAIINYSDHLQNLYIQALSFGHLCKYGYKHQENNFIPFQRSLNINIKKGERIIHVKGSSKVKSHKRRIKTAKDLDRSGDKEKVDKGIVSTDYKESIGNINNYISKLNETDEGKEIMKSISGYTFGNYDAINEYMKSGESEHFKESLGRGLLRNEIPQTLSEIEKSIIDIKKFIHDAPKFSGEVYRGLQYATSNPESKIRWDNFIKNIEGSNEIKFGSFLSTSQNTSVAIAFSKKQHYGENLKSCVMTIKVKSGIPIEKLSLVPPEKEVLLDSDKTYKVTNINKDDPNRIYVQMEEK